LLNLKNDYINNKATTNKERQEELFNLEALKTINMMVDGNVTT
jgi:hypothetical protein